MFLFSLIKLRDCPARKTRFVFENCLTNEASCFDWQNKRNKSTSMDSSVSSVSDSVDKKKQSFEFTGQSEMGFVSSFPSFQSDFFIGNQCMPLTESQEIRIQRSLNYNVPHGKHLRALLFMKSYQHIKGANITKEELKFIYKIGWIFETLHSCACVTDDIVDNGSMRHGRPCWHKLENVGKSMATVDGLILQNGALTLLSKYLEGKSYHLDVLNLFFRTNYQTTLGQILDMATSRTKQPTEYSMKLYETIAEYKTGFYTFYCPIVTSLLMNGRNDEALLRSIKNLSLKLSLHFQIQDDFLDCFGNPEETKKIGNDIEEGKCSWLVVTALEKANEQQTEILLVKFTKQKLFFDYPENYGKPQQECVDAVKKLYEEIGIISYHRECVKKREKGILEVIQSLPQFMPKDFLVQILHRLSQRTF